VLARLLATARYRKALASSRLDDPPFPRHAQSQRLELDEEACPVQVPGVMRVWKGAS
jgi:hypothetical protein